MFSPRGIAVYGVSRDTNKIGSTIFTNLIASHYKGRLVPINPKYDEVFGYKCYPKATAIPYRIDLAIMAVPAELCLGIVKDCAKKKIKNLVIISAGFKEVGEAGAVLEAKLQKLAAELDVNILGPNTLGLITAESEMNASFSAANILAGDIAFMSQSGAICTAMLDLANSRNLGFSHFVSIGNKIDITENDLLEYWLASEKVKVVGGYIEEFADGYDFVNLKSKLGVEKPIVIMHPGVSAAAQSAMSSHTGSLAGSSAVISTSLKRAGITQVNTISESYAALTAFNWTKLPAGRRIGVITNAGGPGIIATDLIEKYNLQLAEISTEAQAELAKALPAAASLSNPIDVIGDAMANRYQHALTVLLAQENVDAVVVILTPQLVTQIEDTAKLIINLSKSASKPIIPVFVGGRYVQAGLQRLADNRIAAFDELDLAVSTFARLCDYSEYLKVRKKSTIDLSELKGKRRPDLVEGTSTQLKPLPESVVESMLHQFDITTPVSGIVRSWEDAEGFLAYNLKEWGLKKLYPLVIKATSEDILHKTDFKAIYLDIMNEADFKHKLTKLQEAIYMATKREYPPILVQQQIRAEEELYIGVKRDGGSDVYSSQGKGFGHMLLFGKGGIHTEVYRDIASDMLPLTEKEILKLINTPKVAQILNGVRGSKPLAIKKLGELIMNLQRLVVTYPEIAEMDINPVMITQKNCYVVDAKILVKA